GGAVQTLPAREGDPEPPPDNGQHIALGCFTEYLRFLERIGEGGSYERRRLALPVIGDDGSVASIEPSLPALLRYAHLPVRDRLRIPLVTARCRTARPREGESFGSLLRRLGASDAAARAAGGLGRDPAAEAARRDARRGRGEGARAGRGAHVYPCAGVLSRRA